MRPWLHPDRLIGLIDELRRADHNIGLGQYLQVLKLVEILQARGEVPESPHRLKTLLAPLLCGSPSEQASFYQRFDLWCAPWAAASATPPSAPPGAEAAQADLREVRRKARRIGLGWLALFGAIAAAFFLYAYYAPRSPRVAQPEPAVGAAEPGTNVSRPDPAGTSASTATPEAQPTAPDAPAEHVAETPWAGSRGAVAVALVGSLLLGLGYVLRRSWWRRQAELLLQRRGTRDEPTLERVTVRGVEESLFPPLMFAQIATDFRRRVDRPGDHLDVPLTVRRTVERGGWFTPVSGRRPVTPEYLVLVDRLHQADHQAELYHELFAHLQREHVLVSRYDFDGDPRTCFPPAGGSPLALRELLARHGNDRLIVFSEGARFFNPRTGRLMGWVELFARWSERTLMTTRPESEWGGREAALGERFVVLPAGIAGLHALQQNFRARQRAVRPVRSGTPNLPPELSRAPRQWLDHSAPPDEAVQRLLGELTEYLGPAGYFWLSACAVYPELNWDLTLYLGRRLRDTEGQSLLDPERLARLSRLPWFREAYVPDWLRLRLISGLTRRQERQVRNALASLLVTAFETGKDAFDLEMARGEARTATELVKACLDLLGRKPPEPGPLRERVFVDFMQGRRPDRLAVALPDLFRKMWGAHSSARRARREARTPFDWRLWRRAAAAHATALVVAGATSGGLAALSRSLVADDLMPLVVLGFLGLCQGLAESFAGWTSRQIRWWKAALTQTTAWTLVGLTQRIGSESSDPVEQLSYVLGLALASLAPAIVTRPCPELRWSWLTVRVLGVAGSFGWTVACFTWGFGGFSLQTWSSLEISASLLAGALSAATLGLAYVKSLDLRPPACDGAARVLARVYSRWRSASVVAWILSSLGCSLLIESGWKVRVEVIAGAWCGLVFWICPWLALRPRFDLKALVWLAATVAAWLATFVGLPAGEARLPGSLTGLELAYWEAGFLGLVALPGAVQAFVLYASPAARIVGAMVNFVGLGVGALLVAVSAVGMSEAGRELRGYSLTLVWFTAQVVGQLYAWLTRQTLPELRQGLLERTTREAKELEDQSRSLPREQERVSTSAVSPQAGWIVGLKWIAACALAGLLSWVVSFGLRAWGAGSVLEVALGTVISSAILAAAQLVSLRGTIKLPRLSWTAATVLSSLLGLGLSRLATALAVPPGPVQLLLSSLFGGFFGAAQWIVLRRVVRRAWYWIPANATAGALTFWALTWVLQPPYGELVIAASAIVPSTVRALVTAVPLTLLLRPANRLGASNVTGSVAG